ncbi:TIGR03621 family F420-dependent LLM class oxidoreductase [Phytoactinopolyspora halotolerans]|nr:TIGR03621 family F420-dependent LLM class oxidoreductase [Phytoactinopolyspora halotolerans]
MYMMTSMSRKALIEKCRMAEDLGYDVIGVADHLTLMAPFPSLMLAAEVTQRPRLTTTVLNAGFYNPALLARDAAGFDQLTEGRFELGIGTGYAKIDFDTAQISRPSPAQRVDHLERLVAETGRLLADPDFRPRPSQPSGPPLLLAGHGRRVLGMAARHADIVGFSGFAPRHDHDIPDLIDSDGLADRAAYVHHLLRDRDDDVELNINVWRVIVTGNRRAEAERLAALRNLSADQMLNVPSVLIGTAPQILDQLVEYRERFGFTYVTVTEDDLEAFGRVIELAR